MARRIAEQSVRQLRERYVDSGAPVTPQLLAKLRRDPRRGVRQIHDLLKRRHDGEREERERMEAMLRFERVLWQSGKRRVAGVDEAGMAPLAGPVVAAAVVFPPGTEIAGVDDSKRVDPERREELAAVIRERASGIGIGRAEVEDIDRHNIYRAGLLAMRRAVEALPEPPEHVLVDAREIPEVSAPQNCFTRGDGIDFSIAAASIIANTHRDGLMRELDRAHPGYGFARHKGYPTAEHQRAIRERGPCAVHRMSFGYIGELLGDCSPPFYELMRAIDGAATREGLADAESALAARREELTEAEHRKLRTILLRRWKTR